MATRSGDLPSAGGSHQRVRVLRPAAASLPDAPPHPAAAGRTLGGAFMNGCDFFQHRGVCTRRAQRVSAIGDLVHVAFVRVRELERAACVSDLFSDAVLPGEVDFWWGVHRACGDEYRRLERQFWQRCPHFDVDPLAARAAR